MGSFNFLWTEDLASADGMHFHVWIPKLAPQAESDMKETFKRETKRNRDAVRFSWDYIPAGKCQEIIVDAVDEIQHEAIAVTRLGTGYGAKILVILKPLPPTRESECPA
jgi:hypothetical protein